MNKYMKVSPYTRTCTKSIWQAPIGKITFIPKNLYLNCIFRKLPFGNHMKLGFHTEIVE